MSNPNERQEHAPSPAGASVDPSPASEPTQTSENSAAGDGCCVSSCSDSSLSLWRLVELLDMVMLQEGVGRASYHHEANHEFFSMVLPGRTLTLSRSFDSPHFKACIGEEDILDEDSTIDLINWRRAMMVKRGPFVLERCGKTRNVDLWGAAPDDESPYDRPVPAAYWGTLGVEAPVVV